MKLCNTCQEEFADKFSFCPSGATLSGTDGNGNHVQNAIAGLPQLQRYGEVLFECADDCNSATLEDSHKCNCWISYNGSRRQKDMEFHCETNHFLAADCDERSAHSSAHQSVQQHQSNRTAAAQAADSNGSTVASVSSPTHAGANYEAATMKSCVKCREQSSDEFQFRARDGATLNQRVPDAFHGIPNIADQNRLKEILASELKELLRQSRLPSGSPQLYQRMMADYVDIMRQEQDISLQNVRERNLDRRRWSICRLGMAALAVATLSVISILLALGYDLPPQFLYVLLGLLGGLLGKQAIPRLRGSVFPSHLDWLPDASLPPLEPARLAV